MDSHKSHKCKIIIKDILLYSFFLYNKKTDICYIQISFVSTKKKYIHIHDKIKERQKVKQK
ncbi:hypothetical protein PFMC_02460 [Plasmodium falciparum CAMP/Malaysia]|uniref:Uncharacterized protein n=1 Tax=Plasmodium falciparum (isolate Camp / Malaysia) TaxID=5835 RepID=A0A024X859_PLAFC|nr:hypothetical protein PFMC_02460 [Plasmodium falciparum CAMP/Malaysia]